MPGIPKTIKLNSPMALLWQKQLSQSENMLFDIQTAEKNDKSGIRKQQRKSPV